MANKTIPQLVELQALNENSLAVIDTGTQTFKMRAEVLANQLRDLQDGSDEAGFLIEKGLLVPNFDVWNFEDRQNLTLPNPPVGPLSGAGVKFSPDGKFMAISIGASPFVRLYSISGSGVFTALPNPSTLPAGSPLDMDFSPDGKILALGLASTGDRLALYRVTSEGLVKIPNPSFMPASNTWGVCFSKDGSLLMAGSVTVPRVALYSVSGENFLKQANPSSAPAGEPRKSSFSPDGKYLAMPVTASPFLQIYKMDGTTMNLLPNTAMNYNPANICYQTTFSPDGKYLAVAIGGVSVCFVYKINSEVDEFDLIGSFDVGSLTGAYCVAFSSDSRYFAIGGNLSGGTTGQILYYSVGEDDMTRLPNNPSIGGVPFAVDFSKSNKLTVVVSSATPFYALQKSNVDQEIVDEHMIGKKIRIDGYLE